MALYDRFCVRCGASRSNSKSTRKVILGGVQQRRKNCTMVGFSRNRFNCWTNRWRGDWLLGHILVCQSLAETRAEHFFESPLSLTLQELTFGPAAFSECTRL